MDAIDVNEASSDRAPLRARRRAALVVTLIALVVLGVGWLADGVASAPRSATAHAQTREAGLATVTLSVAPSPLRATRRETLLVRVVDVSGAAVTDAAATCGLTMPAMDMGLSPVAATATTTPGDYACDVWLPHSGSWSLVVTLTHVGTAPTHATFPLQVG